ncbi:MAG: TIR domain-containing protein [Anaerolineaceae bacterium]
MEDSTITNNPSNKAISNLPFAAYKGDEPYIFISYSHKNAGEVFPIIGQFHTLGYHVWYDEGIEPGIEWPEEIGKALNASSLFVVFITPDSVSSENVRNEINFALSKKMPFIAIYLKETSLTPGLQLQIGSKQAILRYHLDEDSFKRKYIYSFDTVFKKPRQEPRIPKAEPEKPQTTPQTSTTPTQPAAGILHFACDIVRRAACEKLGLPEDKQLEQKHTNVVSELRIFADAYGEQYLACSKGKERLMVYKKESQPVFFFERGSITELSDFSYFQNLKYLTLIFQRFSDISPLANLPIKVLDLSCNLLSDLSPLGKMGYLTNISLDYATYDSLTPLGNIKTLSFLSLNEISSKGFTELCSLDHPNLQTLHIPNSKLESLTGISNLKYLSWLSINDCIIFDFDEIAKLKNLTVLALARTKCYDFSFLKELPLLNTLSVDEEQKAQIIELYGEKPSFLK